MSKHLATESLGTKAMERLELTLCNVYGRRSSIQGQGRHRDNYLEVPEADDEQAAA